uniref:non-specific serine/threonine protein kinase n=1 Tax=Electrophorus electricus TaxID=8005 RepID=A0A4W4DS16_ELEEL
MTFTGPAVQLLKSTETCRHSLMCIKEIGHGWFGKVLLGELNSGLSSTQVVVKELKAGTSVHDQMRFLEEARPYRSLQHSALVQCLAQCTEVSPYLLIMELCPLGDVKGYLRSCRVADSVTPDPLLLQRMACQIASGLLHLHKHNYTHSDLALRNCLLTSDLTVKIGDYGLSQSKYKDDYFVTSDQSWVPLRWIAPEMVNEVHGNLLVVDQTKQSNIWSLGVTIWELFELGNQPYRHYSDRQVLSYAVKDQQLKLPKPLLQFPLADRWYEVMQFCWLQPDQRPSAEEVHLLLSYLCAKGASEAEEDFERRWNSMRPNMNHSSLHGAGPLALNMPQTSTTSSSFPLLEQFSTGDGYQSGDDILTVTETSHGLNFEYKWEQARVNGMTLGVSPQYYEAKHLHTPGVVPVLNAHSTSMSSEYYIRIEEPVDCSGKPIDSYWSADMHKNSAYDSDSSPALSLTMEPLLGQVSDASPLRPWESGHYVSYKDRDGGYYYEPSPPMGMERYLFGDPSEPQRESWGSRSLRQALGELEDPLGISPSLGSPPRGFRDPYIESSQGSVIGKNVTGGYYDMMGSLRKTMPGNHSICIDMESGGALFVGQKQHLSSAWQTCTSIFNDTGQLDPQTEAVTMTQQLEKPLTEHTSTEPESEISRAVDSGVDNGQSSISLVEIDDCSDEDITDVTSGIFGDFPGDYNETVDYTNPTFKSLQKQVGTPDSMESIDLPSTVSSSETFSPASIHPSSSSRAMDSGYDTENNESPEFVPKEPHEPQDAKAFIKPLEASISDPLPLTEGLTALSEKTPYRDSAYFSDCDTAKEKESEEHNEKDTDNLEKQREKSIEIIDKEELLTIQIVEQDNEMPHVGATNENGECIHNNTEEQAENLLLEEDEIVCVSTPEVNVIPPSSAEMAECPGRASPADGQEADEEDGDSEDSDESDEELRTYRIQEQSEESDDEVLAVPIVVSDCSQAHKLRSLLKIPSLLPDSLCDDLESKKKVVSFFDDVTVYLFDQESPTRELAEHGLPLGEEADSQSTKISAPDQQERVNASDDSSDGNISEESAAFEWEDDFTLLQLPTSVKGSPPDVRAEPTLPPSVADSKPAGQFSRFTVSPSTISRFSITHVSDSDIDSAGGKRAFSDITLLHLS